MTAPFLIAESAKLQVENLQLPERLALGRLFENNGGIDESKPLGGGTFVARFGQRRVVWRRDTGGAPVILSVVDRSFAAGA